MSSEQKLLGEIQYLTKLIESHQTAGSSVTSHVPCSSQRRCYGESNHYKWKNRYSNVNGSRNTPKKTSKYIHRHINQPHMNRHPYANTSKVDHKTKHGNLVYKPVVKTDHVAVPAASASRVSNTLPSSSNQTSPKRLTTTSDHRATTQLQSLSSTQGGSSHSPRSRKRKHSRLKDLGPSSKHQKSSSSKYVWKASTTGESSQVECSGFPGKQQLKWRRPSLDKKQTSTSNIPTDTGTLDSKVNPRAKSSPMKSKYKWRRKVSVEGRRSAGRVPSSPLVARGKFSLVKSSLLGRNMYMYPRERNSFQYRRLKYIGKHTPSRLHTKHAIESRKSKNRVWIATSSDSDQPTTKNKHQLSREIKTSRGNKVWVADGKVSTFKTEKSTIASLGGRKYVLDSSKRRLKRTSTSRLPSTSSGGRQVSVKSYLASCAVQRSRKHVWHGKLNKNKVLNKFKHYCVFFNRYGKCSRGDSCPYVHDPKRVAVCPKFLKGACEKTDGTCLLLHKTNKEKMPVCSFFLRGVCIRDNCPYLHVSVDKNASVCPDFITGYCPRGEQCTLQHVLDCPDFLVTGKCLKGRACPLRHRKRHQNHNLTSTRVSTASVKTPVAFRRKVHKERVNVPIKDGPDTPREHSGGSINTGELDFIPLDCDQAPDFIAL